MRASVVVALVAVAVFQVWMIWEVPVCLFHSDSHTYLRTAGMFWDNWHIGIHPKRSFLYPTLLTLLHPVPGRLGLHILLVQHGLVLVVAWLAMRLRRDLISGGGWLDAPLVLFVGLNVPLLFYAHDMMAEIGYAAAFLLFLWRLWRFLVRPGVAHAAGVFWCAALALAIRPDGRMLVLFAMSVMAVALFWIWRRTGVPRGLWRAIVPLCACLGLWLGGRVTQEGWLFFSSVFPLTNLDSPLHAELKEELRPLVEEMRQRLPGYPGLQNDVQGWLGHRKDSVGPKWDALKVAGQNQRLHGVCRDLAIEAVLSDPVGFLKLSGYKLWYVLSKGRKVADELRPSAMGKDWFEQMRAEPSYIPMLWGDWDTWEAWRDGFFKSQGEGRVERALRYLEPVTSPVWWSWAGALALAGWAAGIFRHGWRLAVWLGVAMGCLVLTYVIARGITRYLLPFEPLWALGVAMFAAEAWRVLLRLLRGNRPGFSGASRGTS